MDEPNAKWRVSQPLPIIAGEALDGYIARVCAAHHFPRLAELTQVGGAAISKRQHAVFCSHEGLVALAHCLQIDPDTLIHHAPAWTPKGKTLSFFGETLPKSYLHFTFRRYSPASLRASPHHRGLWTLGIFPFCEESWEYLLDCCPNTSCNHRLEWRRTLGVDLCDFCGEPLIRAEAVVVPEEYRDSLRLLVGLIHPDPARQKESRAHLPERLAGLEGGELLELACALASVIDYRTTQPLRTRTVRLGAAATLVTAALAQTWPLLAGWPGKLEAVLADKINANAKNRGDGNKGASCRFLSAKRISLLPSRTANVVEEFIQQCLSGHERGYTGPEAIRRCGAKLTALVRMRRAGEIPSILMLKGNRLLVLFDRVSIDALGEMHKTRNPVERASNGLGIPAYALRELVWRGEVEAGTAPPGRGSWPTVQQASLETFIDRLSRQLEAADETYAVRLSDLMIGLGGRPKPWAGVLTAISQDRLDAAIEEGDRPMAQRIRLKGRASLDASIVAEDAGMNWSDVPVSKRECAEILGVSPNYFSQFADYMLGPGALFRQLKMPQALELAKTYIGMGEMAQRLGVHVQSVRHLVERRGVRTAMRGFCFRDSAEKLIPELVQDGAGAKVSLSRREFARRVLSHSVDLDRGHRLTLPAFIYRRMGLEPGDAVFFEMTDHGVLLRTQAQVDQVIHDRQA